MIDDVRSTHFQLGYGPTDQNPIGSKLDAELARQKWSPKPAPEKGNVSFTKTNWRLGRDAFDTVPKHHRDFPDHGLTLDTKIKQQRLDLANTLRKSSLPL